MAYNYTEGDGVSVLLTSEPDGATEPVSILDQAVRQIKSYLNDPVAGPEAKIEAMVNPTKVIATAAGGQTIEAGAGITVVQFDTQDLDANGDYNEATFKFTAPSAGLFLVVASLTVETTASSSPTAIMHQFDIFVDATSGARTRLSRGTDVADADFQISRMFDLSAGQTIWGKYTLTVGSGTMTVQVVGDPRETVLQVTKLHTTAP